MNRAERRRARKLMGTCKEVMIHLEIDTGRCGWRPDVAGNEPPCCYACGGETKAWPWPDGLQPMGYAYASILCHCGQCETQYMWLCERCYASDGVREAVAQKFFPHPLSAAVTTKDGAAYTSVEQLKQDLMNNATKH